MPDVFSTELLKIKAFQRWTRDLRLVKLTRIIVYTNGCTSRVTVGIRYFGIFPRKWAPDGNRDDDKVRRVRSAVAEGPNTDRLSPV